MIATKFKYERDLMFTYTNNYFNIMSDILLRPYIDVVSYNDKEYRPVFVCPFILSNDNGNILLYRGYICIVINKGNIVLNIEGKQVEPNYMLDSVFDENSIILFIRSDINEKVSNIYDNITIYDENIKNFMSKYTNINDYIKQEILGYYQNVYKVYKYLKNVLYGDDIERVFEEWGIWGYDRRRIYRIDNGQVVKKISPIFYNVYVTPQHFNELAYDENNIFRLHIVEGRYYNITKYC